MQSTTITIAGLDSTQIHALRRLRTADKIEWPDRDSGARAPFDRLEEAGILERRLSPKGYRAWALLTDYGRKLLPLVEASDAAAAADRKAKAVEDARVWRIREQAEPMLALMKRLHANAARGLPLTVGELAEMAEVIAKAEGLS